MRKEARDGLRDSERAISAANRALTELRTQGEKVRGEAAAIAARRAALERSLAEREQAIARMLAAQQANPAPDALRVALSGEDPAAVARSLYYVTSLARASAAMLADYRATLSEAARLAGEAQSKRGRLDALQAQSRADREKLLAERRERRRVLDQMAGEIRQSRKEIKVLRADAARLARLVEELAVLLPAQARKEPFSKLRGRLSLPVRGELTGRFGAPRGAAGTEAKGLFIRAPQGQPVRAIAGGQVVYAEWMRGFGNLLIVDHGEAYLSIYANNESLLKQVGDVVAAGEAVATTGASGGNEETGLYFEMRHLGRAFDPLRWVKLNK
ncbi:MAG TPA: peptidoglycan DD-metalloendopeptidase family protein [Burkholderiales bacterium]|nr:peptidoglycan DD-metalloendopeptidase family protein [Burkholderiales bacterium]